MGMLEVSILLLAGSDVPSLRIRRRGNSGCIASDTDRISPRTTYCRQYAHNAHTYRSVKSATVRKMGQEAPIMVGRAALLATASTTSGAITGK
ncbi:MAG TPA: hypothetical protein PLT77_12225 [Burkholderiaceae bacterium]|nr:hypothetical protein [Burkholderiaceae bacterium]